METKELRLGNLFIEENSKKIIEVIGLEKTRVIFSGMFLDKWQAIPIALTEEWLLNLGFLADWSKIYTMKIEENTFELRFDKTSKSISLDVSVNYEDTSLEFKHIKYVHQLQNLYFALTGSELLVFRS